MSDNPQQQNDEHREGAAALGHEPQTVSIRGVAIAGISVVVLVSAAFFVIAGLEALFGSRRIPAEAGLEMAEPRLEEPPLDANQQVALQQLRERENRLLTNYAWVNPQDRVARIPVDRAMELIVTEGLPEWERETPTEEP